MEEDPRVTYGRQQLADLNVRMTRANADFTEAVNNGDDERAKWATQEYANADQERQNLVNTWQRLAYAEAAAVQRQPSAEQINSMRIEEMTEPQRQWWFSQQSKHGFDNDSYQLGKIHVQNNPSSRQR
jgi:hypothetical protein